MTEKSYKAAFDNAFKKPTNEMIERFINNLDEKGLKMALHQLLCNPESKKHLEQTIIDYNQFWKYPLRKDA